MMRTVKAVFLSILLGAAAAAAGCAGPARHAKVADYWLETGAMGPAEVRPAVPETLRLAVYGDAQGNRQSHRAVVAAIRAARPDAVLFAGDAVYCFPLGHMPDFGAWCYLIPFWPQYIRGYPLASLATLGPFPAAFHDGFASLFYRPVRDPGGWNGFLEDIAPLRSGDRVPYLFVPGNHDLYHRADREAAARVLGPPGTAGIDPWSWWYSVDAGGVRIVILESGTDLPFDRDPLPPDGPQLAWLDGILADAEAKALRSIVALHLPPFSSSREAGPVPSVRERVVEVLDRHRVDLVISGHAHSYERIERPGRDGRPVTYIVTGGGGGPFHHRAKKGRWDAGSRVFVEGRLHFVLLEIGPGSIRGRVVPVTPPRGPNPDPAAPKDDLDTFEIPLISHPSPPPPDGRSPDGAQRTNAITTSKRIRSTIVHSRTRFWRVCVSLRTL